MITFQINYLYLTSGLAVQCRILKQGLSAGFESQLCYLLVCDLVT